jgi:hypothetical protein
MEAFGILDVADGRGVRRIRLLGCGELPRIVCRHVPHRAWHWYWLAVANHCCWAELWPGWQHFLWPTHHFSFLWYAALQAEYDIASLFMVSFSVL